MAFQIKIQEVYAGSSPYPVYVLMDGAESVRAEVWPSFGFNCLNWQVRRDNDQWGDILYHDPGWTTSPVPTRSGHPILFPFPNRLNLGQFTHEDQFFQLPLNEATGTHAIHGFTPRNVWRVVDQGAANNHAWITGELHLSVDLPRSIGHWPCDFIVRVTYRLYDSRLLVQTSVINPDTDRTLPFGLGFHPYFACPDAPGSPVDEMILQVHAEKFWVLEKAIPTGEVLDLPEPLNFRKPKPIGSVSLDHIYTSLSRSGSLWEIAALGRKNGPGVVRIFADGNFHHVVLFIPPHRRAVAIEPYTCTADAPNLLERGIDSGWREAPPNSHHSLEVEYTWNPDDRLGEF